MTTKQRTPGQFDDVQDLIDEAKAREQDKQTIAALLAALRKCQGVLALMRAGIDEEDADPGIVKDMNDAADMARAAIAAAEKQ